MSYENDVTREMLSTIRMIRESGFDECTHQKILTEAASGKAIAITDDPKFGQNTLSNQIEQFRTAVDGGAQFSKVDEENVANSPLIYLPSDGNLTFSGVIPSCGNLKFQLVLRSNTGFGAWIFVPDGMLLTDRTLEIINKIYQFYLNWREEWNRESSDLERMAANMND